MLHNRFPRDVAVIGLLLSHIVRGAVDGRFRLSSKTAGGPRGGLVGISALLKADFHPDEISIQNYGNVFASVAFLEGLALDEVPLAKLTPYDPRFPMIIGTRLRTRGTRALP